MLSYKNNLKSIFSVFLFAIYPVLVLYAHNIEEVVFGQTILPFVYSIGFALLFFILFKLILKKYNKAGLATICLLIIFWNYGLLFSLVNYIKDLEHWHILPILLFIVIHIVYFIAKAQTFKTLDNLNTILLLPIAVLTIMNLVPILYSEISENPSEILSENKNQELANIDTGKKYPDIYLIILDEFASFKTIKEEWGYDAGKYSDFFKDNGVFMAGKAEVRYSQTAWSVPNLLNLNYLTESVTKQTFLNYVYEKEKIKKTKEFEMLNNMTYKKRAEKWNNNLLMQYLKDKGYIITVIEAVTQHYKINFEMADFHHSIQDVAAGKLDLSKDDFILELIKSSVLYPLDFLFKLDKSGIKEYNMTKYVFDYLKTEREQVEQPNFIFAHILCPHGPFVFDADGNYQFTKYAGKMEMRNGKFEVRKNNNNEAYLPQYIYVLNEIKKIIKTHTQNINTEGPVIIIQSDHGPRPHVFHLQDYEQPFSIFNTVYFPDKDYSDLYDNIGQINTMRVVLNKYFDEDFEMLEER